MPSAKAQLVKWGNSQAVRLPKAILQAAKFAEGDELEITAENGRVSIVPATQKPTLESLVARITRQNRHREQDWGKREGSEVW